jgi:ABC-type transporter Mla subunit MlaD
MNTGAKKPELTLEQLETAFEELVVHFDRTVAHLEQAIKLIAKQGQQYGEAIAWLQDIRKAAGATAPGASHQELCLIIKDLRHRAFENEANKLQEEH